MSRIEFGHSSRDILFVRCRWRNVVFLDRQCCDGRFRPLLHFFVELKLFLCRGSGGGSQFDIALHDLQWLRRHMVDKAILK